MLRTRVRLVLVGAAATLTLLWYAAPALAQTVTQQEIPWARTGNPVYDEAGNPIGGSFVNPCTNDFVHMTGTSYVTIEQGVKDAKGEFRLTVTVKSVGTGYGWIGTEAAPTLTGRTYVLDEAQQLKAVVPTLADGSFFESTISDKFTMKGQGPTDNWVIRAFMKIKVNSQGQVQVLIEKMNADFCKG